MEQPKKIRLYQSRDFSGNFDTSISFIKQNYGVILKGLLIFIPFLLVAIYFFLDILRMSTMGGMNEMAAFDDPQEVFFYIFSWKFFVGLIILSVVAYLMYLYPMCYMALYAESQDGVVKNEEVWAKVKQSALPLFGYGIIYFILVFIGSMLCFIPGIIAAVYLCLYSYIYLVEKRRGIVETFQRSFDLINHNWWVTLGIMLVFSFIIGAVSFIFTLPVYGTMVGAIFQIDFLTSDIFLYITYSINYVARFLLNPIMCIVLGVIYFSYRNKLEGISTYDEIDMIGTTNNSDQNTQY
ncbi:MAG: hypothetical protein LBU84_09965 [Prevotella sp.]|jgi:hypothetical protein|nr:hypothetical protein [Prevotella sp.]